MSPVFRRLSAICAIFALVAAACGGTDGGTDGDTSTAAGSEAPAETSTTGDDGDNGTDTTAGDGGGTATTTAGPTTTLPPLLGLELELLADGLAQPTVLASPPGDDRIFVGERQGVIYIYDPEAGRLLDTPFMNIPDRVASNGIEQGLLGMAFHPDYADNGRFFIYHTDRDQQRQLAEYRVQPGNPNKADLDSGVALFDRAQPEGSTDIRHYGGMLMFGPDGYLYISTGDGAAGRVTGQSTDDYFGAILRIDVDSGDPYTTPPDNPYSGGDAAAVWATGLRNPWRMTIDGNTMYIADVGQADNEEVNAISLDDGGTNFGWATMEGSECFSPSDCDQSGLTLPIYEYTHSDGSCSITGGHVYRGELIPELQGHYFFADWCVGWVRSLLYDDGAVTKVRNWSADLLEAGSVNVFGLDADGELYLANHEGNLFAILPVR